MVWLIEDIRGLNSFRLDKIGNLSSLNHVPPLRYLPQWAGIRWCLVWTVSGEHCSLLSLCSCHRIQVREDAICQGYGSSKKTVHHLLFGELRVEMRPFMASVAVIFGVDFPGPHILVVNNSNKDCPIKWCHSALI